VTVAADKARAAPATNARQDQSAFEATFREHYPRVFSVLFRLVGDPAEAEDLTVETFWRLWQRAPDDRGPLGGWLYRVAVRLGFNALRAARRRTGYESAAGRDALEQGAPPDPAQAAERAEERRHVRAALARLPARDAELLVLRHAGLAYKEIAAALGIAPGSVGTLLARAEREFEKLYMESGG